MANSSRSFGIELSRILLDTVKQDSTNLLFFLGGETASAAEKNTVGKRNVPLRFVDYFLHVFGDFGIRFAKTFSSCPLSHCFLSFYLQSLNMPQKRKR